MDINETENEEREDQHKMASLIMAIGVIRDLYPAYHFKTEKFKKKHSDAKMLLDKIINHIKQ